MSYGKLTLLPPWQFYCIVFIMLIHFNYINMLLGSDVLIVVFGYIISS